MTIFASCAHKPVFVRSRIDAPIESGTLKYLGDLDSTKQYDFEVLMMDGRGPETYSALTPDAFSNLYVFRIDKTHVRHIRAVPCEAGGAD